MVFSYITSFLDMVPMRRLPRTKRFDFGDEIWRRGEVVIRTEFMFWYFMYQVSVFECTIIMVFWLKQVGIDGIDDKGYLIV